MSRVGARLALRELYLEVLPHHANQVPNDLQVHILGELRQAKEDSSQVNGVIVLLEHFKVDGQGLLDDRIVILGDLAEIESNCIDFLELR